MCRKKKTRKSEIEERKVPRRKIKVIILGVSCWPEGINQHAVYSRPHDQVNTERRVELRLERIRLGDLELGDVEEGKRDPERAVRGERSGTKGVSTRPLLNTCNDLGKTTVAKSKTQDHIRVRNVASLEVEEREDKRRAAKTKQSVLSAPPSPVLVRTYASRPRGAGLANFPSY